MHLHINTSAPNPKIFSTVKLVFGMMFRYRYVLLFLYSIAGSIGGIFSNNIRDIWNEEVIKILNDPDNGDFLHAINKLKIDLLTYDFYVDNAIPWKEMEVSMEALELLRKDEYENIQFDLIDVYNISTNLMNDYKLTTNSMFQWAVIGRERLNFIVDNIDQLKKYDTNKIT